MRIISNRPAPHVPDAAEVAKLNAFMNVNDNQSYDDLRAELRAGVLSQME